MNPRKQIADRISPILPSGWRYVKTRRVPDRLDAVTVVIGQDTIDPPGPQSEVPFGHRKYTFTISIADPSTSVAETDSETPEDRLDDEVEQFLDAIDSISNLRWTTAKRVKFNDTNPNAYDVTVEAIFKKG